MKRHFACAALAIGVLCASLAGCGTDKAALVADTELGFTPLATAAASYMKSGAADEGTKTTLKQLVAVIDHKEPDGTRTGLLVAARTAAMSGDDVAAAAENEALVQAIKALADYETKKGIH